jgi:WhiB family transcriptional regulator, redox-sensing transcriptional regulator
MTLNVATTPRRATIEWRVSAACRFVEPELFFPVSAVGRSVVETERAKSVCAHCPVRRECLQFALATHQAYGVWGGMSEEERRAAHLRTALSPTTRPKRHRPSPQLLPGFHDERSPPSLPR